jgi:hypothetical protein
MTRIGVGPVPVAGFKASGQLDKTASTSISARRLHGISATTKLNWKQDRAGVGNWRRAAFGILRNYPACDIGQMNEKCQEPTFLKSMQAPRSRCYSATYAFRAMKNVVWPTWRRFPSYSAK